MMNKKDTKIKGKNKTEQVQISPYACAPCCEGMNTCNFEPTQTNHYLEQGALHFITVLT
jgi:hypothetical protein